MGENIISINGKDYLIVNRKPETGDLILCNGMIGEFRYTDGIYNIVNYGGSVSGKDAWDIDDCRVLLPLKAVETPQVNDILANLARRVASLEQQLSATQSNVEKLAEELAETKHHTYSIERDVMDLEKRLDNGKAPKEVEVVTFEKFLDSIADKVAERLAEDIRMRGVVR